MSYRTVDEAENFEFQDAEILEMKLEREHLVFNLGYVTILPENSCNRDIRKMGTNELMLQIQHAKILRFVEEGYKVYDADENLTGTFEDREVPAEEYTKMFETLVQGNIYSLIKKNLDGETEGYEYEISMDANEHTYQLIVTGTHDVQVWERFMNRESTY
ncbi:MAG: subtilin biosynthesis sensor protein SpaK [Lachnospiraceae bacterium]|nr:subtilin biosynthesis sensor protein SpaK [Lachnospiraceae bacterium]